MWWDGEHVHACVQKCVCEWEGGSLGDPWGMILQRSSSCLFCRRQLWSVQAWAEMSTMMLSIQCFLCWPWHRLFPMSPEGRFWRGCHGVWHAQTMQVSISWQLPVEVPVDPQGSWSCSAPSCWSCAPSRRCRRVSSGAWFRRPGSFSQTRVSKQVHVSQP